MSRAGKTVSLDIDLWRSIETEAARTGVSVSQVVREALLARLAPARAGDESLAGDTRTEASAVRAQNQQVVRHSHTLLDRARAAIEFNLEARGGLVFRASPGFSEISELHGRRCEAQPLSSWLDAHVHPDDRDLVRAAVDEAVGGKSVLELEHRAAAADGSTRWTVSRAVPLVGKDGQISEWLLASGEVTHAPTRGEPLATST